jgi:hypothetical protein
MTDLARLISDVLFSSPQQCPLALPLHRVGHPSRGAQLSLQIFVDRRLGVPDDAPHLDELRAAVAHPPLASKLLTFSLTAVSFEVWTFSNARIVKLSVMLPPESFAHLALRPGDEDVNHRAIEAQRSVC